jgi:hypothetical protein
MLLFAFLIACTTSAGPCDDYCSYICDCHAEDSGYNCDDCFTSYDGADASLQDECESSLITLKDADEAAGLTCNTSDSGTGTTP